MLNLYPGMASIIFIRSKMHAIIPKDLSTLQAENTIERDIL